MPTINMTQETEDKENNLEKGCKPSIEPGIKWRVFPRRSTQTKSWGRTPKGYRENSSSYEETSRYN